MYNFTLPNKTPDEEKVVTFPFADEAAAGAVLSGLVMAKALIDGDDTDAALLSVGTPQIQGLNVLVLVSGGKEANTYGLLCGAHTDNGEFHQVGARTTVTAAAA